jgi:chemotaxis protein methyltransferase CheR
MMHDEEIDLLLHDVLEICGYDFTEYAPASLRRRISRLLILDKITDLTQFRQRLRSDKKYGSRFIEEITVNVTEMFRDPGFYKYLRQEVIPVLAAYPFIRIWHAGCSTGEEAYSMAILLQEAGILEKSLIYATDINPKAVDSARSGIFPLGPMKQYSENYILAGGMRDFSSYYTANSNYGKLHESLKKKIVFSTHNLASDGSFNEFHLILCRNVLIYFNKKLQEKVFLLLQDSLAKAGYLALGTKETLRFSSISTGFRQLEEQKIWKKTV